MTSPPPPNDPAPIRIEVPTEKVDATLDLVEILNGISAGVESMRAAARGAAPGGEDRLASIGELANRLAAELAAVQGEAPDLQAALEEESAKRSQ
jgi:hypothetical protein